MDLEFKNATKKKHTKARTSNVRAKFWNLPIVICHTDFVPDVSVQVWKQRYETAVRNGEIEGLVGLPWLSSSRDVWCKANGLTIPDSNAEDSHVMKYQVCPTE